MLNVYLIMCLCGLHMYTHSPWVGVHSFMFVHIFALGKVNAYIWCGMSVYAYEGLYFGRVYMNVPTHPCRCGWNQCV